MKKQLFLSKTIVFHGIGTKTTNKNKTLADFARLGWECAKVSEKFFFVFFGSDSMKDIDFTEHKLVFLFYYYQLN